MLEVNLKAGAIFHLLFSPVFIWVFGSWQVSVRVVKWNGNGLSWCWFFLGEWGVGGETFCLPWSGARGDVMMEARSGGGSTMTLVSPAGSYWYKTGTNHFRHGGQSKSFRWEWPKTRPHKVLGSAVEDSEEGSKSTINDTIGRLGEMHSCLK